MHSIEEIKAAINKIIDDENLNKEILDVENVGNFRYKVNFKDGSWRLIRRKNIDDYIDSEYKASKKEILTALRIVFTGPCQV